MTPFDDINRLARAGRPVAALDKLESYRWGEEQRLRMRIVKASLLEQIGRLAESRSILHSLLNGNRASVTMRARAEYILGKIERENGAISNAVEHLQKSSLLAERCDDMECVCLSNVLLLAVIAQQSGFEAVVPLLNRTRTTATKLGDPQVTALLHLFVGQLEAKRGFLNRAARHAMIASEILNADPNLIIEAHIWNTRFGIALLQSDIPSARIFGRSAVTAATESGAAAPLRASLGNMGNLHHAVGEYEQAVRHFERAIATLPTRGEFTNANLDGIARVRLSQGRLADARVTLERIEQTIQSPHDWYLYANRCSVLTYAQLEISDGNTVAGLERARFALRLAERSGDDILKSAVLLAILELPTVRSNSNELVAAYDAIGRTLKSMPPQLHADYECSVALSLASKSHAIAEWHARRSIEIHEKLSHVRGANDIRLRLKQNNFDIRSARPAPAPSVTAVLDSLATALTYLSYPDIAWSSLCEAVAAMPSLKYAAVERIEDGKHQLVHSIGVLRAGGADIEKRFELETVGECRTECVACAVADAAGLMALNIVEFLADSMRTAQRAKLERESREALWTNDEPTLYDAESVICGHLAGLTETIRRVAKTKATVLLLGESGTGKEILARAVHDYSDRASRPFVPINCAAVPPHLLESTLFGHRRGAFTGADRDSPGLIRSAREGTVFLDEIGELALDLQPKLLRFLESGEIAPLGDTTSTVVNVRIVAATNRNLLDLVQEGRFREDLFYRLNVVRLTVKPLRERRDEIPALVTHFVERAAKDYNKGYVQVAEETLERLLLYRWPGNVRQLQNEIRRMVALVDPGATLEPDLIAEEILAALPLLRPTKRTREIAVPLHEKLPTTVAKIEREMIKAAMRDHQGRVDDVAKALGISRKGLYLKRQRLGV